MREQLNSHTLFMQLNKTLNTQYNKASNTQNNKMSTYLVSVFT